MPDFAITQAWNCGNSTISAQDAAGAGLDLKKCHFHGRCIALTTNECHSFAVKHAWDYKRDRRADCSWARLVNPEVKASDVFLFGLHPNIKPETFLVGSEAYKLEVKASHMLLRGFHPT